MVRSQNTLHGKILFCWKTWRQALSSLTEISSLYKNLLEIATTFKMEAIRHLPQSFSQWFRWYGCFTSYSGNPGISFKRVSKLCNRYYCKKVVAYLNGQGGMWLLSYIMEPVPQIVKKKILPDWINCWESSQLRILIYRCAVNLL